MSSSNAWAEIELLMRGRHPVRGHTNIHSGQIGWGEVSSFYGELDESRRCAFREAVLDRLRSTTGEDRITAIALAGLLKVSEAVPELTKFAEEGDSLSTKAYALGSLRQIGDPAAIRIARALLGPPPWREQIVTRALAGEHHLLAEAVLSLVEGLPGETAQIFDEILFARRRVGRTPTGWRRSHRLARWTLDGDLELALLAVEEKFGARTLAALASQVSERNRKTLARAEESAVRRGLIRRDKSPTA